MLCSTLVDELGFQALDRRDAHRLFQIVNHRYERTSTIITSNKSITEWPAMLAGDEALAAAILDRLLHHCHAIQNGWRQLSAAQHRTATQAPSAGRCWNYKRRDRGVTCSALGYASGSAIHPTVASAGKFVSPNCGKVRVH